MNPSPGVIRGHGASATAGRVATIAEAMPTDRLEHISVEDEPISPDGKTKSEDQLIFERSCDDLVALNHSVDTIVLNGWRPQTAA